MDMSSLLVPGTQSLVTSILTDGWTHARDALARHWSRKGAISRQAATKELDQGHALSEQVAGADADRGRLEAFWLGYLAGLAAGQADLLDAVRELGAAQVPAQAPVTQGSTVHNTNSGQVGTLLQAGDLHGTTNITFGR